MAKGPGGEARGAGECGGKTKQSAERGEGGQVPGHLMSLLGVVEGKCSLESCLARGTLRQVDESWVI